MAVSPIGRRYIVRGRVQGVGYRYFVQQEAVRLGLNGSVKNRADGSVEVYAWGPPKKIEELHGQLWSGPRLSRVANVEDYEADPEKRTGFRVDF